MSRFISAQAQQLAPYTPGEQPRDMQYIKLNTNESPFPPSPKVPAAITAGEIEKLNLYSDPTCSQLNQAIAEHHNLAPDQVITGNGSDELLSFAFKAFCGAERGIAFSDITYGFYKVWAKFYNITTKIIPLSEDFTINIDDYIPLAETVVIANPNAPTGIALPTQELERLLQSNPDRVVIVDEAYVDFGGESCTPLISRYDNLLVMGTFSKSRALAGGRIGFAMGNAALIADLNRVKYSFNPYNINRLSLLAGAAAMADTPYFEACRQEIIRTRQWITKELGSMGFTVLPSCANFVFAKSDKISGGALYAALKEKGILVRHFDAPRISDYCRITIGSMEQMAALSEALKKILH